MIEVHTPSELSDALRAFRGQPIGFVPTMGFLHDGHLSLVRQAKKIAGRDDAHAGGPVVVSIFVNPTQFNDPSDFQKYPSNIDQDRQLLKEGGADILYLPKVDQIYPTGFSCGVKAGALAQILEGPCRPGHFDGVVTVVSILFNQVQPTFAIFGEKDFQQLQVIKQMVRDFSIPVQIYAGKIMREESGLAMSSRNSRLSEQGRQLASAMFQTINRWFKGFASFESALKNLVAEEGIANLHSLLGELPGVTVEYVSVIDEETLMPVTVGTTSMRAVLAAFVEGVRLIDAVALEA